MSALCPHPVSVPVVVPECIVYPVSVPVVVPGVVCPIVSLAAIRFAVKWVVVVTAVGGSAIGGAAVEVRGRRCQTTPEMKYFFMCT